MATTTPTRRRKPGSNKPSPARKRRPNGKSKSSGAGTGHASGGGAGKKSAELALKAGTSKGARRLALAGLKRVARGAASKAAGVATSAAAVAVREGREVARHGVGQRLPIQRAVDIAVPLRVAWEEWMALELLPEGVHTVSEIERDGDELVGTVTARRSSTEWRAEILDERPRQSFAWRSYEGGDCAGLITFHQLSARLTRLELNLDVVPTGPAQAAALSTHLAHRRAEIDLRRFKARLELINPDLYEGDEEPEDAAAS